MIIYGYLVLKNPFNLYDSLSTPDGHPIFLLFGILFYILARWNTKNLTQQKLKYISKFPYAERSKLYEKLFSKKSATEQTLEHEGIRVSIVDRLLRGSTYGASKYSSTLNFTVEAALGSDKKCVLNLYKKSFITFNFVKRLGARTVNSGNEAFDSKFMVECEDEEFARRLLTAGLQHQLLELSKDFSPRLYIGQGVVSFAVIQRRPKNKEQENKILSVALMIFSRVKAICPCPAQNTSVQQQDEKCRMERVVDLFKTGVKTVIIILIGLILFCAVVMKILS